MTSEEWYQKGNQYRQKQDWKHAMECYLESIEKDPESPACEAKKMLDMIFDFYCKDMYNP
jgi:predicted Ser/Thr protein kinase